MPGRVGLHAVVEHRAAADRIDGHALAAGVAHRFRHGGLVGRCDGFGQMCELSFIGVTTSRGRGG